jgi:Tfp pilus assembly protein PilF
VALVLAVAAIYGQVGRFGFVNLDDDLYVYENARVLAGLTWSGFLGSFTTFDAANWHPVTWLSHMLDAQLFGADPGPHHLGNVLLHALNTVLLLVLLLRSTGQAWRSALVAALFAVHPLHVESVAWISERKDVLSTFFWLLTMLAWVRYVREPGRARYALVGLTYALGLLSKPMLVTLPVVLVLFDVWPLRRLSAAVPLPRALLLLVREKAPLLVLAAASSAITIAAQSRGGAVMSQEAISVGVRLQNAAVAAATYLWQMVWPVRLAAIYPHPALVGGVPAWQVALSLAVLGAVTGLALRSWRRQPAVLVGWLWYLVTLLPVIGIVQVGGQAHADRYTYVPLIGIFLAIAWAVPAVAAATPVRRFALGSTAAIVLALLALQARRQVATWRDNFTLYENAIEVTTNNFHAWRNIGSAYDDVGKSEAAIFALRESLRILPTDANTMMLLGIAHGRAGQHGEAMRYLDMAVRARPESPMIWFNLGVSAALAGRWDRAVEAEAVLRRIDPAKAAELGDRVEVARSRPGSR